MATPVNTRGQAVSFAPFWIHTDHYRARLDDAAHAGHDAAVDLGTVA
jgi:hypothetical protein